MLNKLRDWLAVLFIKGVLVFGRFFTYETRITYGSRCIERLSRLSKRQAARIKQNLTIANMHENIGDMQNFNTNLMRNFAQNILELQYIEEFSSRAARSKIQGDGYEAYQNALLQKTGVIIVSGHIGHWEALRAYSHIALKTPLASIYKESRNPHFEKIWQDKLGYNGEIVTTGVRGTARLVKILKSGGAISLLHDQRMAGAPLLPFFGQDVQTSTAAAELALKYNVPLIPAYAIRQENPLEYKLIFEMPIAPSDALTMTRAMNDSLEAMVRRYPEQWIWNYSRFRHV